MTISIWRYSHLALAVSSFVFILIASITGIILAVEPISNQLKPYAIKHAENQPVANTITVLENTYDEIITIEIDDNNFVQASVITKEGKNETFYINPFTGEKIGDIIEKAPIYQFATNLHRSLFLKSTGRFIIGFVSLLLFLIAVSGILLIVKRQGGIKRFFSKIVKENFEQYYHIVIGRFALIPIAIIALTGVFLSLGKFNVLPTQKIQHTLNFEENSAQPKISKNDFEIFKNTHLKNVKQIEFPFSDDAEDYFHLKLKNKEVLVNQYTGEVLSNKKVPFLSHASYWSMALHTGRNSALWSLILLLASCSTLFFIYSGFTITLTRRKNSHIPKNIFNKDDSEYIILVGSETGSTFGFASLFFDALVESGKKVFISELNKYTSYNNAKRLIIFTSTYGEGEPPTNAKNFEKLLDKIPQKNSIQYSIVGFGSLAYSGFCNYAIKVNSMLQLHKKFSPNLVLEKINNQSFEAFKSWTNKWSKSVNLSLELKEPKSTINLKKQKSFTVVNKTNLNIDDTFLIELQPPKNTSFASGDLLSIYPEDSNVKRLYSIGKINNNIVLSVKKHAFGVCSNYLSSLKKNDVVKSLIKPNKEFHFPKKVKDVILIANGTGIAPFLGMINEKHFNSKTHLFWGGRTKSSYEIYKKIVDDALENNLLSSLSITYSQEKEQKKYVQDLILKKVDLVTEVLQNDGVIMICGSIAMQNSMLKLLESITTQKLEKPLSNFQKKNQIKTDCY